MPHELTWTADPAALLPRDARLEQLLASFQTVLGHDLPNQLVAFQGMARLLKLELSDRLDAETSGYLDRLAYLSRKTDVRARTLADVIRLYRDPWTVGGTKLDEVVRQTAREVKDLFPERVIEYDLENQLPLVHVPRRPLQRVVFHLMYNAVEAAIEGRAAEVRVSAEKTEVVVLHIADKGRGLTEPELKRLFPPFAGVAALSGPGLGLFLARETVALWGGGIRVQSEPGQGSTFSLLFSPPANK